MYVEILKTDGKNRIRKGEIYKAEFVDDDGELVDLLSRLGGGRISSSCIEYAHNVRVLNQNEVDKLLEK